MLTKYLLTPQNQPLRLTDELPGSAPDSTVDFNSVIYLNIRIREQKIIVTWGQIDLQYPYAVLDQDILEAGKIVYVREVYTLRRQQTQAMLGHYASIP